MVLHHGKRHSGLIQGSETSWTSRAHVLHIAPVAQRIVQSPFPLGEGNLYLELPGSLERLKSYTNDMKLYNQEVEQMREMHHFYKGANNGWSTSHHNQTR